MSRDGLEATWRLRRPGLWLWVLALAAGGCAGGVGGFPAEPIAATGARADYDTDGDGVADFFFLSNPAGRFDRIGYDRDGDGRPDHVVHLDAIPAARCRHLVLVLDGIPFDVVKEFYAAGHLRMFSAPAVVIPPYPVMTDPALEDAFGYMPCLGYEARYYDRSRKALVGGVGDYLAGRNEPFARIIDYRAPTRDDALVYLQPKGMFAKELAEFKRLWDRRERMEMIAYFVSSAGLGSRAGKEGQLLALRRCEQVVAQVLRETGGLVKVTLMADHGQTNVPCEPARLGEHLRAKGWRLVDRPRGERDVAMVRFGLVTSVALSARRPARLAEDLLASEKVTLVSFVRGDAVVVRTRNAEATIRSTDGKTFEYKPVRGDPLGLAHLAGREINGREVLRRTSDGKCEYPDALYRLWRAHFALAENAPDVLVSLDDRYYNGSSFFGGAVKMASTHGGLNWRNSATFIMSTAGPIGGPIRSEDIPRVLKDLLGRPFPLGK